MNLAQEVSSMETEMISLKSETEVLRQHSGVLESENEGLRRSNAKLQAERDTAMRRAEAIKVLLDQCGSSLIHGIQQFHASERNVQEQSLGVGTKEDMPKFLTTATRVHGDATFT
jgi:regulator of replication initiation timing